MNFDQFKTLVSTTKSTRRFQSDITIEESELLEVIDTTRVVSSAKNMQPLKYITVTNTTLVDILSSTAKWATHLTTWTQSKEEQPSAFIIILQDRTIDGHEMVDCGIALQTLMLALKIKGYDSCPLASINHDVCKDIFNLPPNLKPMVGLAVGKGAETINIVPVNEDTNYYRDDNDNHCVPKRDLEDILIGKF